MNRLIPALLALAACLPAAAGEAVKQQIEAAPDGEVSIDVVRGKVIVAGWDQNMVGVEGTRDDDSEEFIVKRDGNVVSIEDDTRSGHFGGSGKGTNITVMVPRASTVRASMISADFEVRDVSGGTRIETVSGNIVASKIGGDVRMETVSGDIKTQASATRLDVESVSGDIELQNDGVLEKSDLSTVSGDLTLHTALDPDGDLEMESVSGDLTLVLRGEINVRISAETGPGGDIDNGLSADKPEKERYVGSETLELKLGDGGADIDASVISSTISFSRE